MSVQALRKTTAPAKSKMSPTTIPMETETAIVVVQKPDHKRVVIESVVVFIIAFIVIWAALYFLSPKYVTRSESSELSDSEHCWYWKPVLGVGFVALIIAIIYGAFRHHQQNK
uniref:Transmembrane protein n=1 Tax=viral metagenome TaxID=1070528 RepID=A0A6C0JS80_9ZZZZ